MTPRRSGWRAYLLLSRISNLPTVWTNVLAGMVAAGVLPWGAWLRVSVGSSLLYTAGMFLNDVADHEFDARHRPDRPIPAGDVSPRGALTVGVLLMSAGLAVIAAQTPTWPPLLAAVVLVLTILHYDYRHKTDPLAPLVMGVCRGLVYLVAALAVAGTVSWRAAAAAAVLVVYVSGLTVAAKRLGASARWIVPTLIAGISVVDAAVVLACGGTTGVAFLALSGFALTLVFQRIVPGD
jgi:4-hydroxybenzoate polyprenyltransferase